MLLSVIVAFLFPFELFLFVYAFLGPLHYLTEINWLHKKQYFTTHKNDYIIIIVFTLIISALFFTTTKYKVLIPLLTFIIFAATFGMVFFTSLKRKIVFGILCGLAGVALYYRFNVQFRMVFSVLLPTIVHVFIFTGLFILLGALRSKSAMGITSVIVFTLCALVTLFANLNVNYTPVSQYIHDSHSVFRGANRVLISFLNALHTVEIRNDLKIPAYITDRELPIYMSDTGIRVMRFIAFAYTYHYLNWFSKTSVIQWHNTKKINLVLIVALWIASVALYIYNYRTGLRCLYVLSLAHVLLEFPLNHRSFIDIKQQLAARLSR